MSSITRLDVVFLNAGTAFAIFLVIEAQELIFIIL